MSWSKPRKLKLSKESNKSDRNQIWSSFEGHFKFVSEYYKPKNILNSPMVQETMYGSFAPLHIINKFEIKNLIYSFSRRIDATFNKGDSSLGWLSLFGALLERCEELEPGLLERMRGQNFVEFGPGLGFAGQIYSQLFEAKGLNYDLNVVTKVRNLCLKEFNKYNSDLFIEPEEFESIEELEKKVLSLPQYSFISTWAFTESPINVRNKFEKIIANSNTCLIVSNKKFSNISNFKYLQDMSERLPNHKHLKCDLSFLKNAPSFQQKHQLHLFICKNT